MKEVIALSSTHAPPTHVRRLHADPWLFAVVALSAGLVALGTWTIVDRSSETEPAAAQIVDDLNAAVNAGDAEAVRALFATGAVFRHPTGERTAGLDNVVNTVLTPHGIGLRLERIAPVTTVGDTAATFVRYRGGGQGVELAVFEFKGGKIVRMSLHDAGRA